MFETFLKYNQIITVITDDLSLLSNIQWETIEFFHNYFIEFNEFIKLGL